jgi:multidrug resistance efflux pump
MKSRFLATHPRLRRFLPWGMWGVAAAVGIPIVISYTGYGSSPAVIDSRVAMLAPMRTAHRLRIEKILVSPGQKVKQGELLVQMNTSEIDADLAVAQAKLAYIEVAEGWRQLLLVGDRVRTSSTLASTAERAAIDMARIVAEAERDRSELLQLDANLEAEQKVVNDQLAGVERLREMKRQRAALSKKVEQYKVAVDRARKSATGSVQRLGDWTTGAKNAGSAAMGPANLPGDMRSAALELQRQEIARLQNDRSHHEVRAPFDGIVGEVKQQIGDLSADPEMPVVTLVEERSSVAIAYLSQSDATKVRVGDLARLVPRDLSGARLYGRVTSLAPNIVEIPIRFRHIPNVIEFGRAVYIRLDKPDGLPGQAFEAAFSHGNGAGT